MSPDVQRIIDFYRELFGWETREVEVDHGFSYTFFTRRGRDVAAVAPLSPDMAQQGVPSAWTTYIAGDADEAAERARGSGGRVTMEPADVMHEGRITMLADPSGAVIGVWQARDHGGAGLVNEPGAMSWNELNTTDLDAARAFYQTLFGWETAPVDTGGGPAYATWQLGDRAVGGCSS
jgi:hypothetical protein